MLPRLEAEERLVSINDGAAAAGRLKREDTRRMISRLERAALGSTKVKAIKPTAADLAAIGVAVSVPPTPAAKVPSDG